MGWVHAYLWIEMMQKSKPPSCEGALCDRSWAHSQKFLASCCYIEVRFHPENLDNLLFSFALYILFEQNSRFYKHVPSVNIACRRRTHCHANCTRHRGPISGEWWDQRWNGKFMPYIKRLGTKPWTKMKTIMIIYMYHGTVPWTLPHIKQNGKTLQNHFWWCVNISMQ